MYVLEAVGLAFISLTLQIVSITGVVATVWDCNLYQPINTARSKADRVEDLRISPDRGDPSEDRTRPRSTSSTGIRPRCH